MSVINFANDFELFQKENLGSVRALTDEHGIIWFVAKDVCDVLDIGNPTMALKRLDDDEKYIINPHFFTLNSIEGEKRMGSELNIINEYGLYSLIFSSRKPQANEFKRWLTHDVIPAIRQHGGYVYGQEKLPQKEQSVMEEELADMANMVKKLRARRHELISEVKDLKEEKRHLKKERRALNEYAELFEDMFEKAQDAYAAAVEENEVLKTRIEKMKHPERFTEPDKGPQMFVTTDGVVMSKDLWSVLNERKSEEEIER